MRWPCLRGAGAPWRLRFKLKMKEATPVLRLTHECRLIPLAKNPGVRPIGVWEVLRRIVGKAIISVVRPEIMSCTGQLQLCAGQASGCEAAVHAISDIFEEQFTDALLLIDADNAFNSLNRKVLLYNIRYLCPPMAISI